jgi:hypothetical protein
MTRHPRRQLLGQRTQLGPGLRVELVTGDILGDQWVVVARPLRFLIVGFAPLAVRTAIAPIGSRAVVAPPARPGGTTEAAVPPVALEAAAGA